MIISAPYFSTVAFLWLGNIMECCVERKGSSGGVSVFSWYVASHAHYIHYLVVVIKIKFINDMESRHHMKELLFTIPTYRYQDAHHCVQAYAENFRMFGHHDVPVVVFDDSPLGKHEQLVESLQQLKREFPKLDLRYVGPEEKGRYLAHLEDELGDPRMRTMLRPSYGGNRNWILLGTLGEHFISVDDDMRPYGLIARPRKSKNALEGTFTGAIKGTDKVDFDIIDAYGSMLGKPVRDLVQQNPKILTGKHLFDSNNDVVLNTATNGFQDNFVSVVKGDVDPSARLKIVQTYLSGDADIDSKDLVAEFLHSGTPEALAGVVPLKYVVHSYRPCIVSEDYRITGALLGLDNSDGFICFIPTSLRFEDYIFRLYSKHPSIHVGYADAVQTHERSLSNRNNIVKDYVIESIATIMKKKIMAGVRNISDLAVKLEADPQYDRDELVAVWQSLMNLREISAGHEGDTYRTFTANLEREAFSLESPEDFSDHYTYVIAEEYANMRHALGLWPEMLTFSERNPVPMRRIDPKVSVKAQSKPEPSMA